jgi:hypothetical protein
MSTSSRGSSAWLPFTSGSGRSASASSSGSPEAPAGSSSEWRDHSRGATSSSPARAPPANTITPLRTLVLARSVSREPPGATMGRASVALAGLGRK